MTDLIEIATTFGRATETRDFVLLERKMIICGRVDQQAWIQWHKERRTVSNLIAELNILLGVDDDLFLSVDCYDLRCTIGITRMVDQPPVENFVSKR